MCPLTLICNKYLKITLLKLLSHLPGGNKLIICSEMYGLQSGILLDVAMRLFSVQIDKCSLITSALPQCYGRNHTKMGRDDYVLEKIWWMVFLLCCMKGLGARNTGNVASLMKVVQV